MTMKTAYAGHRAALAAMLGAMLVAIAGPAAAVERGFYIAADYGKFRFNRPAAEFDAGLDNFLECFVSESLGQAICNPRGIAVLDASSMGRKSRGYDLWVGYQLSPWFAVEGAYLEMGKSRQSFSGTIDLDAVNGTSYGPLVMAGRSSFRTRGAALAGVGNLELGEYFSLDARAGLFFADNRLGIHTTVIFPEAPLEGPQRFSHHQSDSKSRLFYGASANFWISPYYSVRAGFTAYNKGYFGGSVQQYFIGIRYSYGY